MQSRYVYLGFSVYSATNEGNRLRLVRTKKASTATKGTAGLNLPIGLTLHLIGPDRIVQLLAVCSSLTAGISTHFFPFLKKRLVQRSFPNPSRYYLVSAAFFLFYSWENTSTEVEIPTHYTVACTITRLKAFSRPFFTNRAHFLFCSMSQWFFLF